MNSITIIFFRSMIASVCLISFMLLTGNFTKIKKEHMKTMLLLSLFQPAFYFIFELYSLQYNSATLTSLIISLVPLFVPFALFVTDRIRVMTRTYIAIAMSIAGVSIILLSGGTDASQLTTDPIGVVLAFCATGCAVMYSTIARKITVHYNALVVTTYQNIFGFIFFAPIFFAIEHDNLSSIPLNSSTITSLLLLGVFCSAIAFMVYLNAVKHLGVMISTITNNISPIFTVIGAYFIFGEKLFPVQIIGIVLTVSSLFVGTFSRNSEQRKKEEDLKQTSI